VRAWRTLDFKPAPPGWRVIYLNPGDREVLPMAGWLVQDSYLLDLATTEEHEDDTTERRVIAAVCTDAEGWTVRAVDDDEDHLWTVLAPGEPEPTQDEEAAERARRAEPGTDR